MDINAKRLFLKSRLSLKDFQNINQDDLTSLNKKFNFNLSLSDVRDFISRNQAINLDIDGCI